MTDLAILLIAIGCTVLGGTLSILSLAISLNRYFERNPKAEVLWNMLMEEIRNARNG